MPTTPNEWIQGNRPKRTFLIGVAGGTASGKTSVCRAVVDRLQLPSVQILSMDCFYRPLTDKQRAEISDYNFDHPNAFDWELLLSVLKGLKQGKAVKCPQYDFATHSRKKEFTLMYGADAVLCEGILILHHPKILEQFDVKVFVKTDDDIRLIRRIKRDMANRGRKLDGILAQYQKTVHPSYHTFCEPTQVAADVVIPRGRENVVAIQLLCDHIKNKLVDGGKTSPVCHECNAPHDNVPVEDELLLEAVKEPHKERWKNCMLERIMASCNKLWTEPKMLFSPIGNVICSVGMILYFWISTMCQSSDLGLIIAIWLLFNGMTAVIDFVGIIKNWHYLKSWESPFQGEKVSTNMPKDEC